ncbi:rubredoxin [Sinomicrobium weinanense]|uniref:Rubredoxin n=1 Tax=Sinomicrobium weinanense TaxID=2842200 RepID=A0A926JQB5_9FLAO|nr:rubredoxin [Sinomicrobium weinanense]MBC9795527.1 rubredoxin [Sinomicrobium weinanense]MBU3123326.1 rubredoxin [Sinomicrobium weinanense]
MKKKLSRLTVKGGVLSPRELKTIIETAEEAGLDSISFGSRQDILFPEIVNPGMLKALRGMEVVTSVSDKKENIVSSYVSADIFPGTGWLTGDRYLYILEQFKRTPSLKVNITDPAQRLVPLFTGHLNFIASGIEDYWYLHIRLPDWEKKAEYPALINSWDIEKVASAIEDILPEEPESVMTVFHLLNDSIDTNNRTLDSPLEVPFHPFPYYEGMNRLGSGKYWLGLYWRNNLYDIRFLKTMCDLCMECKIGKVCITPWKSFIVKGIPVEFKLDWEKFLGINGINVRHSMLELNWHVPVGEDWARELKKYLVGEFDKNDISTYGLTFGITGYRKKVYYFTSVVIERNTFPRDIGGISIPDTYNLLYARDFDPNTLEYVVYAQDIDRRELPGLLMELSRMYFKELGHVKEEVKPKTRKKDKKTYTVYQCGDCLTVYNPEYGDTTQNILPGTAFGDLPEGYCCPLCEAPKSNYAQREFIKE